MTGQFAVSTVTAGSETRGIGHDNTSTLGLTEVGERLVRRVGIGRDENVLVP
jgi:hypothetical protein